MEEISKELQALYEQNAGCLVNYCINNHLSAIKYFDSREDMFQTMMMKVWQCLPRYDKSKAKFSTFVMKLCENLICLQIRKLKSKKRNAVVVSSDSETSKGITIGESLVDDYDIEEELNKKYYTEFIYSNIGQVAYAYYIDELNQIDISRILNVSQSHISKLIKKDLIKLRVKIRNDNKLNFH